MHSCKYLCKQCVWFSACIVKKHAHYLVFNLVDRYYVFTQIKHRYLQINRPMTDNEHLLVPVTRDYIIILLIL